MRILLIAFAATQTLVGALLWLTPGFFHDEIGPYGARNDHYMADLATFYIALGVVAFVALRHASWRVPLLVFAVVAYTLHSLNHLIDVGEADPSWLGPANLALIALSTVLLGWMLQQERAATR
jgi:hypothetical protein